MSILIAAAIATSLPPQPVTVEAAPVIDVSYDTLATGADEQAIAELTRALARQPEEPALLLNLAAAYRRTGNLLAARECLDRVVSLRETYSVELADGRWIDTRRAARIARADLDATLTGSVLAAR